MAFSWPNIWTICCNNENRSFLVKSLFAPTSQSRMSKMFRDSESLREKMGRGGLRFDNFYFNKACKIAAQKKLVFGAYFAFLSMIFLVSVFLTPLNNLFAPTSRSPMSKLFRVSESLGKSNGKKWSQIWKLLLIKGVKSPRKKKFFTDFFLFVHYI